ncbi:VOC family protein [bacterium]|nr:VOC family protein [bacterium]
MFTKYKFFIFTEDPDELVKFYTNSLGWGIVNKLEYELDYGYTLEISPGNMQVWLAKHSEVSGYNKEPYRHMMNLYTDNVQETFEKVKGYSGVKVIAEPFSMGTIIPGEERFACTILDPEGNCLQFMGKL